MSTYSPIYLKQNFELNSMNSFGMEEFNIHSFLIIYTDYMMYMTWQGNKGQISTREFLSRMFFVWK